MFRLLTGQDLPLPGEAHAALHLSKIFRAHTGSELRRPEDPVGQVEVGSVEHIEGSNY